MPLCPDPRSHVLPRSLIFAFACPRLLSLSTIVRTPGTSYAFAVRRSVNRASVLVALVTFGACEQAPSTTCEVRVTEQKALTSPAPSELERILNFVETMPPEHALYLDDVGWFQLHHYKAYDGRNPRTGERMFVPQKALLMFQSDLNLISVLNGRPREDLGDPTHGAPDVVIHRFGWAQSIARQVFQELVANGVTEIAGFGTLRVEQREVEYPDGTRVSENRPLWEMSEQLRDRLVATVAR